MSNKRFFVLLTKLQTERLSKSERKELDNLLSLNPELEKEVEFVSGFWSESEFTMEADGDRVFGKISKEINTGSLIPLYSNQQPEKKRLFTTFRVAASIIFFMAVGIMTFFILRHTPSNNEVIVETQIKRIEKITPSGQKHTIFLPDGSIVVLNSESKLSYTGSFGEHVRMVELEGEAFFEVSKNVEKPFIVKSGGLITTALGTSFNVRGYRSENNTQVTLVTGRVLVESEQKNDQKFILDPGFGVQYLIEEGTIIKEKISVDKIIGWKDGILQFEDDDFQTVTKRLSRWYGVEFVIEKPFTGEGWRYSGWFKNDYLDNVLRSISFTQDFNYKIENEKVTISKRQ